MKPAQKWKDILTWLKQDRASLLLLLALSGIITFICRYSGYDDAFITYRYAYNLATSHGLVYNPGEHYLGTTAPLYAILLGLLGIFDPDRIPLLGNLISGACLAGIGIGLVKLGRVLKSPVAGFFAGLLFVVNPVLWKTFGGEMLLQSFLVLWSLYALLTGRPSVATVLLCLGVLVRPDALLMFPILLGVLWRSQRRFPLKQAVISLGILLPFCVASCVYYGQLLPGTLAAKQAQLQAGWDPLLVGAVKWISRINRGWPASQLPYYLALCGVFFFLKYPQWKSVLIWPIAFIGAYIVLGIPFYHWYLVPGLLGMAILGGIGVEGLLSLVEQSPHRIQKAVPVLLAGTLVALAAFPIAGQWKISLRGRSAQLPYRNSVAWVDQNTAPNDTVGYYEIGVLGYYTHRRIVDPFGLITPGAAPYIASRDANWAFRTLTPTWILVSPTFRGWLDERATWFKRNYRLYAIFPEANRQPMSVYHRIRDLRSAQSSRVHISLP